MKFLLRAFSALLSIFAFGFGQVEVDRLSYRELPLGPLGASGLTQYYMDHIIVEAVEPGFAAAEGGLEKFDLITAVKVMDTDRQFRYFTPELPDDKTGGAGPREILGNALDDALATESRQIQVRVLRDADHEFYVEDDTLKMNPVGGEVIFLTMTLPAMPSLSQSWPFHPDESRRHTIDEVTTSLCDYIAEQILKGEHTKRRNFYTYGGYGLCALISSGQPKYHQAIRLAGEHLMSMYSDEKYANWSLSGSTWSAAYTGYFLCEYYAATGDQRALAPIKNLMRFTCRTTRLKGYVRGRHGHSYRQSGGYGSFYMHDGLLSGLNGVTTIFYSFLNFAHNRLNIQLDAPQVEAARYSDDLYRAGEWSYQVEQVIAAIREHMGICLGRSSIEVNGQNIDSWTVGYWQVATEYDAGLRAPQHAAGLIFESDEWLFKDYADYPDMDNSGEIDSARRNDKAYNNLNERRMLSIRFSKILPGIAFNGHAQSHPGPFWSANVLRWAKTNQHDKRVIEADITDTDRRDATFYNAKRIDNGYESFMRFHRWWFTLCRTPLEYKEKSNDLMRFIGGKGNNGGDNYIGLSGNAHSVPAAMLAAHNGKLQIHGYRETNWFPCGEIENYVSLNLYEANVPNLPLHATVVERGQSATLTYQAPPGKRIVLVSDELQNYATLTNENLLTLSIAALTETMNFTIQVVDRAEPVTTYSCAFEVSDGFFDGNYNYYGAEQVVDNAGGKWTTATLATHDGAEHFISKMYWGDGGTSITDLTNSAAYPQRYDELILSNTLGYDLDRDDYGAESEGWITPTQSGNYTFYIKSDNAGEFWLSTDETPENLVKIAEEINHSAEFKIGGTVSLIAGQPYFFRGLHTESRGGDHFFVGWKPPNSETVTEIPGSVLTPHLPFNGGEIWRLQTVDINRTRGLELLPGHTLAFEPPAISIGYLNFEVISDDLNYSFHLKVYRGPRTKTALIDRNTLTPIYSGTVRELKQLSIRTDLSAQEAASQRFYFEVEPSDASSAGLHFDNFRTFEQLQNTVRVQLDLDGKATISTGSDNQFLSKGETAEEPTLTVAPGYIFTGWDRSFEHIEEDTVITAQFSTKRYPVEFVAGSHGVFTSGALNQTVAHGEAALAPTLVTDPGWRFAGWDYPIDPITGPTIVTATYTSDVLPVTVKQRNGRTIFSTEIKRNERFDWVWYPESGGLFVDSITRNGEPIAVANEQRFGGLTLSVEAVTEPLSYEFEIVNRRTDQTAGSELLACGFEAEEGYPTVSTTPEMDESITDVYGNRWIFDGNSEIEATAYITDQGNAQIKVNGYLILELASYQGGIAEITYKHRNAASATVHEICWEIGSANEGWQELVRHTVTEKDDYGVRRFYPNLSEEQLTGKQIRISVTRISGTANNGVHLDDLIIRPITTTARDDYQVVFNPGSFGQITQGANVQTIPFGGSAQAPTVTAQHPEKPFTGWDRDFSNVTEDLLVSAQYNENRSTVTFNIGAFGHADGMVDGQITKTVVTGGSVIPPLVTGHYVSDDGYIVGGWQFVGWDQPLHAIDRDQTINAQYLPAPKDVIIKVTGAGHVEANGMPYDLDNFLLKTNSAGIFHFTVTPLSGYKIKSVRSSDGYYAIPENPLVPFSDSFAPGPKVTFTAEFVPLDSSLLVIDTDFSADDGFYNSGRYPVNRTVDRLGNIWTTEALADDYSGVYSDSFGRDRVLLMRAQSIWNETSILINPNTSRGFGELSFQMQKTATDLDWDLRAFVGNEQEGWSLVGFWRQPNYDQWQTGQVHLNLTAAAAEGKLIKLTARLLSHHSSASNHGIILKHLQLTQHNPLAIAPDEHLVQFVLGDHLTLTRGELLQQVADGQAAMVPEFSVAPGYQFNGWSAPTDHITSHVTITALVTPQSYTVDFIIAAADQSKGIINDRLLATQSIMPGATAHNPGVTLLDAAWRFDGWSAPLGPITNDTTFTAQFNPATSNQPPEFTLLQTPIPVLEGEPINLQINIQDEATVTLTLDGPNWLRLVDLGENRYTLQGTAPAVIQDEAFSISLTATDNAGFSISRQLTQMVYNVNQAPTLTQGELIGAAVKGFPLIYQITAHDEDVGDTLTFSASGLPNGCRISRVNASMAEISGIPTETGTFTVSITITDASGATASADYLLSIEDFLLASLTSATETVEELQANLGHLGCHWSPFPEAQAYRVEFSPNENFSPSQIKEVGSSLEATLGELKSGEGRFARVWVQTKQSQWLKSPAIQLFAGYYSQIEVSGQLRNYPARRWSLHNNNNGWSDGSESRFKIYDVALFGSHQAQPLYSYQGGQGIISADQWMTDLTQQQTAWTLEVGADYQLQVTLRDGRPTDEEQHRVALWIDFNQDGLFTAEEQFESSTSSSTPHRFPLRVPDGTVSGPTLLRIRSAHKADSSPVALSPYGLDAGANGVEPWPGPALDFLVQIKPNTFQVTDDFITLTAGPSAYALLANDIVPANAQLTTDLSTIESNLVTLEVSPEGLLIAQPKSTDVSFMQSFTYTLSTPTDSQTGHVQLAFQTTTTPMGQIVPTGNRDRTETLNFNGSKTYIYGFEVDPYDVNQVDLDGNGALDARARKRAGDENITEIKTIENQGVLHLQGEGMFDMDHSSSLAKQTQLFSGTRDYSLEFRLKGDGNVDQVLTAFYGNSASRFTIYKDRVSFADITIENLDNQTDYHIFRLEYDHQNGTNGDVKIFRDNQLIITKTNVDMNWLGTYGGWFGGWSVRTSGRADCYIDYLAFAEPAALPPAPGNIEMALTYLEKATRITIEVDAASIGSQLVIRQFKDGYWQVVHSFTATVAETKTIEIPEALVGSEFRLDITTLNGQFQTIYPSLSDTLVHLNLVPGWNMLSLPMDQPDLTHLETIAVGLWSWDRSEYTPLPDLEAGQGFWVQSAGLAVDVPVRGQLAQNFTLTLKPGWNLVGGVGLNGTQLPVGHYTIYSWDAQNRRYVEEVERTTLEQFKAYWVYPHQ